jgi:hypothetical protein
MTKQTMTHRMSLPIAVRTANHIVFLALFLMALRSSGQGTLTFTFEGQPSGTRAQTGYAQDGMQFYSVAPGTTYLSGGGVPGYPDNGTGYLYTGDSGIWFSFTSPNPIILFNLVSFDAARYWDAAPPTLEVIGHKPQIMGPSITVTNFFTLSSGPSDFQTFYPDSSFMNVFQVEIFGRFSLDNVVISGVPEPSASALLSLGASFAVFVRRGSRLRRK